MKSVFKKRTQGKKGVPALILAAALLAGCGGNSPSPVSPQTDSQGQTPSQASPSGSAQAEESFYPVSKDKITVTYWVPLHNNAAKAVGNYGEIEYYKRLEELTNVHIEFTHPAAGQEKELFNLMIASRELPDIVEGGWGNYGGSIYKAYDDGLIVSLNSLLDEYAPHFRDFITADPEIEKLMRNDDGQILAFTQVRTVKTASQGPVVRKDWLDELGLPVPETLDDWHAMLTAFKEQKKAPIPFIGDKGFIDNTAFLGAYGIGGTFYVENGEVRYGKLQPEYREYLKLINQWYEEGLIDPEFASNTTKTIDAKFTTDEVGSYFGYLGGGFTNYLNLYRDSNPNFNIEGVPYPVLNKGDVRDFGNFYDYTGLSGGAAISSTSKYAKEIAKMFDYHYTEQGILEGNFGYEGVTYELVDGKPVLSDTVLKNPEGLSYTHVMSKYNRASANGITEYSYDYFLQVLSFRQQKEALALWSTVQKTKALPTLSFTSEETEITSQKLSEINTYNDEMIIQFVMGKTSLDKYDSYVEQLDKLGIQEVLKVYQQAYERFLKR